MNREGFRQRLKEGPLLLDGAMATILHARGIPIDACFDAINFGDPALVADIHRRYIEAGADIIETDSFGANRFKFAHHGLENKAVAINRAAVMVARKVIQSCFKEVLLAGIEMRLFRKKIRNGADFVITQPIFDRSRAKVFLL